MVQKGKSSTSHTLQMIQTQSPAEYKNYME